MKQRLSFLLLFILAITVAKAQDPITQPQGNYGLTSVLDGAPPGPGAYYMGYASYYSGTLVDFNGDKVATPNGDIKVNSLLFLNQAVWITNTKALGGNLLFDVLVPLVNLNVPNHEDSPIDLLGKNSILGDITVGIGIQWSGKKLFGLPYHHRLELDYILPTGGYDENFPVNVGAGFGSFQPYYAQSLFFNKEVSLSLRHHLTFNSEAEKNLGTPALQNVKAGNYYHVNYSLESLIGKKRFKPGESGETRLALQGYYGTQFGEDQVNGNDVANSKEKIFAVGPALHFITKKGLALTFKTAFETGAQNRTQGVRSTFRLVKYFPSKPKE